MTKGICVGATWCTPCTLKNTRSDDYWGSAVRAFVRARMRERTHALAGGCSHARMLWRLPAWRRLDADANERQELAACPRHSCWLVTQLASSVSSLGKRDPRSRRGGRTGATPARAAEGGQADPPFASPTRDKMGSLDATRDELATRPARRETASRLARRDFAQGRPRGAPPFGMDPDPANFDFGKFARIRELFRWD